MRWIFLLLVLSLTPAPARAADKTTTHTITLPGGPLSFTATVETIRLADTKGAPAAEIVTTAFLRPDMPGPRPVTFAFNGGPGAASAFLNLGVVGPWRVPIALPITPSQDPAPVDNPDTWLPFTDLVFIDPPGTGYSRAMGTGDNPGRAFYAVEPDIQLLATTIHRWLVAHQRLASPIFLAGESYGGFRAPRLARALLDRQSVGVRGIVLISPVLDFNGREAPYDPLPWATRLPSMAAATQHAASRASLAATEDYARTEYMADLLRGPNDAAALDRLVTRLTPLTGLDPALIRRRQGRIDMSTFLRDRTPGRLASPYDSTIDTPDPFPGAAYERTPDPVLDALRAPFGAAMLLVYQRLEWQPDGAPARAYELLSNTIAGDWDYGKGRNRPESMTALRHYLALDPAAHALVVHGLTDLVTPYFASKLLLDQIPTAAGGDRIALETWPGGHMFYTNPAARAALHDAAARLITPASASPAASSAHP